MSDKTMTSEIRPCLCGSTDTYIGITEDFEAYRECKKCRFFSDPIDISHLIEAVVDAQWNKESLEQTP